MFVRHWDLRVWNPDQRTYTVNGRVIAQYDANGYRITRWRLIREGVKQYVKGWKASRR